MITKFYLPTKIIFGPESLAQLGAEAKKLGRKAILVTGSGSMRRTGVLDRVVQDLKDNGVPNPRASTVDEGARIVRSEGIDLIIGLGGGSAMDTAKGMTLLVSTGTESIVHHMNVRVDVTSRVPLPLMLVPTVAASGSEINRVAVITDWETHEKRVLLNPLFYPKVSIIDPALTLTLPEKPTAQGGVDAFCHVVECYLTTRSPFPLTDGIMETTMRLIVETLPQVLARLDDIEARTRLSWASTVACSQFVELGGGAGFRTLHGIEHTLSGYYDIVHGDGLAALLPAWMRYTLPAKQDRFDSLGKNVFGETDGILATEKWLERVGMKLRLRDLGIEAELFEEMANSTVKTDDLLPMHPRVLDAAAIAQIYQDSY